MERERRVLLHLMRYFINFWIPSISKQWLVVLHEIGGKLCAYPPL
jgi:hypothetical protein